MVAEPKEAAETAAEPEVEDDAAPEPEDAGLVVHDAAPVEDDGETGDRVELVRTGLVRIHIDGKRFRLRRPFFGEFKKLRLSLEDTNDEIAGAADDQMRVARQNIAEAEDHAEDDPDAFVEWRADMRKRSTTAARALTELAEARRYDWWVEMFSLLTLDGVPDDYPAWITDPNMANTLLGHWRTSPSGRG